MDDQPSEEIRHAAETRHAAITNFLVIAVASIIVRMAHDGHDHSLIDKLRESISTTLERDRFSEQKLLETMKQFNGDVFDMINAVFDPPPSSTVRPALKLVGTDHG